MISTLSLNHDANPGKVASVVGLLPEWQYALTQYVWKLSEGLRQGGKPPKFTSTRDVWFDTRLSARQLKSVSAQASEAWSSYLATAQAEFARRVARSSIPVVDRTVLYRLNKQCAWRVQGGYSLKWFVDPTTGEVMVPSAKQYRDGTMLVELPVEGYQLRLAATLFKRLKTMPPQLGRVRTMLMDGAICERQSSNSDDFLYWLRVSTLAKGKPVYVPLRHNSYFVERADVSLVGGGRGIASRVQVGVGEDGDVTFSLVLHEPNALKRVGDPIAVDANFNDDSLLSFSDGSLRGGAFVAWVKRMDERILVRQRYCQRKGVPLKSDRQYKGLVRRVRDFTKNEIGRILNRVFGDESKALLVFESLDFRGGGLSRRMNRLLTRMGRRAFGVKVSRLEESHGVRSLPLNAAYSSQECSRCHYVSRSNRSGRLFRCGCCGYKSHADLNSTRVLLGRSKHGSDPYRGCSRSVIRDQVDKLHSESCRSGCAVSLSRVAGTDNSVVVLLQ